MEEGSGTEYWQLMPGSEGYIPPNRIFYSWNVLVVPALRYAGLVQ